MSLWLQHAVVEPLDLWVTLGDEHVTLQAAGAHDRRPTARIQVTGPDTLPVHVVLGTGARDTLAVVAVAVPVVPAHVHWIGVHVGSLRPAGLCVGQVTGAPLRTDAAGRGTTAGDSIFVSYGSVPRGAEC